MTPTASIILICYRQRSTIIRALESLLTQDTPFAYEVVVADDGSTDGTRELVEDYLASHELPAHVSVRLLPKQPNRGLVLNYFGALRQCRGRYVTDCAGDDHWIGTSRLREAVRLLDANPEVNVVYTDFIIRSEDTLSSDVRAYSTERYARWAQERVSGAELMEGLLDRRGGLPYLLSAAVFRREVAMEALEECEEMVCNPEFGCEDLPLMLALAARGDAMYLPEVTMVYYEGGDSVSSGRSAKMGAFYLKSMVATRTLATHYGFSLERLGEWYAARSRYIASLAFQARDRRLAAAIAAELSRWPQRPDLRTRLYLFLTHLLSPN